MSRIRGLLDFLFPPFCFSCGEVIAHNAANKALCEKCFAKWLEEKDSVCEGCWQKQINCTCMPKALGKSAKKAIHLVPYGIEDGVGGRLVLEAKDHHYEYLFDFLSTELTHTVRTKFPEGGFDGLTFVPRSKKKIRETGVDQSKELARETAKKLGIDSFDAFGHRGTRQQKKLGAEERFQNAEETYFLKNGVKKHIRGRNLLLVDDVLTTGASTGACSMLLKKAGAKSVTVLTVCKTPYKKKKTAEV